MGRNGDRCRRNAYGAQVQSKTRCCISGRCDESGIRKSRAGSEALPVPVAENLVLNEELAVRISYFPNETCQGAPVIVTIPVVTVEAPSNVPTLEEEQRYYQLVNAMFPESPTKDGIRAGAERAKSTHHDRTRDNATPPRIHTPSRAGLRQ